MLTGVIYGIALKTPYFVCVVAAIPSWSAVKKSVIEITNDLNINNNEIFDEFT